MKIIIIIIIFLSLMVGAISAQIANSFKYQAVVRDNAGQVLVNKTVGFRISILQTNATGPVVYSETHSSQTNAFGLVNLEIGNGTIVTGEFSGIAWGSDSYFVKIELDDNNDGLFAEMGTSQLLSVPYSLYANKAGNGFSGSWFDLTNTPDFATVATSGRYVDLKEKPNFAAIATSGSFADLLDKPNFVTTTTVLQTGDVLYYNGTAWQVLQKGINGQTLRLEQGLPIWGEPGYALPLVTTVAASDIMVSAAKSGGNVVSTGYTEITVKGVCWATTQNPTIADSKTSDGTGIGSYISEIKDLLPNTSYYVRAYATNSAGTGYGNQITFKTFQTVVFPTVTTAAAINITETAAASGGNVTATGGAEVIAKGVCWSTNQNPTIADRKTDEGTGSEQFNSQMDELNPGTIYYVRAYATNSAGTGYGTQIVLTTSKTVPIIITKNVTSITAMGGVSGGTITLTGGSTISDKGICWSETENPTINDNKVSAGTGSAAFNSAIGLLKPNTTCYVRAYAVNEIGIAYGDQKSFTTEDAFSDGFETGFSGTTGGWGIITGDAVEGAYSLYTKVNSTASLTRTLSNSGQIIFYLKVSTSVNKITFYIDDVIQGTYSNTFWGQQSYPVTAGEHTFKWQNNSSFGAWIDFIVMPK
jgi:hypothetical protein